MCFLNELGLNFIYFYFRKDKVVQGLVVKVLKVLGVVTKFDTFQVDNKLNVLSKRSIFLCVNQFQYGLFFVLCTALMGNVCTSLLITIHVCDGILSNSL